VGEQKKKKKKKNNATALARMARYAWLWTEVEDAWVRNWGIEQISVTGIKAAHAPCDARGDDRRAQHNACAYRMAYPWRSGALAPWRNGKAVRMGHPLEGV